MEELKIIEPIKTGLHQFKTTDGFSIYYNKHKQEMNEMTTQKLNKQFKIEGYRITKIGTRDINGKRQIGNICLKKIYQKINKNNYDEQIKTLSNSVDEINEKITKLTSALNSIIKAISENND